MQRTIPANYFTLADIEYLEGARLPDLVVSIGNKTKVVPSRYGDQIGSTETDFRKCCELRANPTLSAVKNWDCRETSHPRHDRPPIIFSRQAGLTVRQKPSRRRLLVRQPPSQAFSAAGTSRWRRDFTADERASR